MICPNCGAKIPDDKLYCEKCGAEFQIVPDYDVEVEGEIDKTLKNIGNDDYKDIEFDDEPNLLASLLSGKRGNKIAYVLLGLILVLIIVVAVVFGRKITSQNTLEYQLEMVDKCVAKNKLLDAIPYLEKAYKFDNDSSHLFKAADYYYTEDRIYDAIYTLMGIATDEKSKPADKENAYRKVITLYEKSADYAKLAEVVGNCELEKIKKEYQKYLVAEPVFNFEEGTYEEAITLKISTDLQGGSIYYTTDNSTPDETSELFSTPLFLEYGNYTVNAIYVNSYGIKSAVVTKKYHIDVEFAFEPVILTESGHYDKPTKILAEVPVTETLYYTKDGTTPTNKSNRFVGSVQMPYGKSTFKFISYALDGTPSEIVTKEYEFIYDDPKISPGDAVISLMVRLVDRGILVDTSGVKNGYAGKFEYWFVTAYTIEGRGDYFFVAEYYADERGQKSPTNIVYAIDVTDVNKIYRVNQMGNDNFNLIDF